MSVRCRAAVDRARARPATPTVLFLDEIHRLNKAQQDALLPHVESGLLTLIGATTENPSFEVNSALLSRARVYVLKPLDEGDLVQVLEHALADNRRGLGQRRLRAATEVLQRIARAAGGDARRALGLLESAADFTWPEDDGERLDEEALEDVLGHHASAFDKQGDAYYDLLSAVHKSVRSSRPDAALLYIARFIDGGGDPLDIARRLRRHRLRGRGQYRPAGPPPGHGGLGCLSAPW
ncbi:MAG: AAA family ATPase [Arhodomonas sp.]|nr:AAA family ATPase [Arhodomonas sp.]